MRKIVITSRMREVLNDLQIKQARALTALEEIQGLTDIPCETIDTLTGACIASYVSAKVREVECSTFLT